MKSQQASLSTQGSGGGAHHHHQQQQRHMAGPVASGLHATSSTKKSATGSSFFEKHAFGGVGGPNPANFASANAPGGKMVSKIHANSSSSYNMHRQNATRGDSNQAHLNNLVASASGATNGNIPNSHQNSGQPQQQISRDKPSSKQFSQNMLSKSQQFATLQCNQAMLSQQTYLAQGIPQMQQQNFIGQGLVTTTQNASLNSSVSQLNTSAHYDGVMIENSSAEHLGASGPNTSNSSPNKRQVSKTSLGKRKNTTVATGSGQGSRHGVPHSQPTERTDGGASNMSSAVQMAKVAGMVPPSSQTSLAQKRYSVNSLGNTVQGTMNSGGIALLAQQHSQPQIFTASQLASQVNITKSESNNKLRRISNMKHKNGVVPSDNNKAACDQRNVNLVQSQMHTANTTTPGLMHQFSQQSQNSGLNCLQQSATAHQSASGMLIGAQKSSISSNVHPGVPANMSNLTSFGQSHSERTSITDEAHTSGLINMQWPNTVNNQHAQCSTQRYTNEQKNHFIQQLHSSKETFGTTSQNSGTYHVSNGGASGMMHGGIFSKKHTKDKLFFVTDHKLYEDQLKAGATGVPVSDQNSSGGGTNNSTILRSKAPSYIQHHAKPGVDQQNHVMQHDIEMEDIQVHSSQQQQLQQPISTSKTAQQNLYFSHKASKKSTKALTGFNQSNGVQSTASLDSHQQPQQRGAAAAPVSTKHSNSGAKQHHNNSIVCPIYQSKDIRLMTGQQAPQTTKHQSHAGHQLAFALNSSKTDQKDVKRGVEGRRDSNKGGTNGGVRRSMSGALHEDVYMAKSENQKPRKRTFKTSSAIESNSNQSISHKNSVNSSDTYERPHYQQMKKNPTQQRQAKPNLRDNSSKAQLIQQQDELYHSTSNPSQVQPQQQQYNSETSSLKGNQSINQERRDAEPLADKLLYLTNQACLSKVKSKSQLTQSMKSSGALRKGIKSPQGSQSTLQEPSAKAMPTSSKVKISQKFNKFEQSNPKMGGGPGYSSKQNLFQTKTMKKQGSGPLQDFKEGSFKSPDARHLQMKKTGSISYAILPRQVIPHSELKAQKKMKSPSPQIKLQGQDHMQRMRSPQNVKAMNNSQLKHIKETTVETIAQANVKHAHNQAQPMHFEARRLSQQRGSHVALKPPHANNKSHLIENTPGSVSQANISAMVSSSNGKQHPQSVTSSIGGSKRISFSDLPGVGKVLNNEGADEAKKLYCMVDSRKSSQSSLQNVPILAGNLNQVQILQCDAQGNAKAGALNKVQLKTRDKLQNYSKPAGFLSQSPKAKKPAKGTKFYEQNISQGSGNNHKTSQSQLSGKHKYVSQMQAAYSQANHHAHRELVNNSASVVGSIATAHKALLQIQAPKVVHLQSPPSRILVKASPRVSPNPKIRHHKGTTAGIQTCKVSIDVLQKGGANAHQKVNRAHSKEFLKTIKLMKRGSNSPSISPGANPHYLKSSQGSPANSSMQNQLQSSAIRGLKTGHQTHESASQLKNYNSQQADRQLLSSQSSKSTLARQSSQNSKLFSRLKMRKAQEAQFRGASGAAGDHHQQASFSERQSQDRSKASQSNNGSFLGQASQSMVVQHSGHPITQAQFLKQQYSNSLIEPVMEDNQVAAIQGCKASGAINMRERTKIMAKEKRLIHHQGQDDDGNRDSQSLAQLSKTEDYSLSSGVSIPIQKNIIAAQNSNPGYQNQPAAQLTAPQQTSAPPQSTPSKRVKAQQVVPVLAKHVEAEDYDEQEGKDLSDIDSKIVELRQGKSGKNTVPSLPQRPQTSKAPPATIESERLTPSKQLLRPNSKQTTAGGAGGVLTSMSNEEQKEQAAFVKDLEKLKRMFKLHFQNYNTAPPTTNEFYRIGRVLGKGAFGKVSLAMHKLSEQLVAIKSMSRETLRDEVDQRRRTKLEMGILKQCNHPNVVRLFDTFETTKHICFVIELCSGGDLFLYIKKRRRLKEDVARFFFKQLIEGLAYIHNAKKVVHRDIKLENILLDATGNVKICDFGVSRQLQTGRERMKEQCGTPAYIAPEILLDEGYTGFKVDMWSAGVCLYAMLIGSVPFKASTMSQLQGLIIKGDYDFKFQTNANSKNLQNPKAATTLLSEEVQDLIGKLLQTDPNKRYSAVETLQHPWLQKTKPDLDVYTDKEKQLIQKEYMRLNLKLSQKNRLQSGVRSTGSRIMSGHSANHLQQETEQALFTEHHLETRVGEEEPNQQNQEEKSFILAPFNSVKSMFIDQSNQIKEIKKDDPPFNWPRDVTDLLAPRRTIKFMTKCREKNRIYEQNNNADLDNGVYNEFVNEQEREEGALMKQAQQDAEDQDNVSDEGEGQQQKREMVSQEDRQSLSDQADDDDEGYISHSEDSLEGSFKETELASDDEQAEQQVAENRRLLSVKKQNEEAISLLRNSTNSSIDELILDTDEHEAGTATPVREHMQSPVAMSGAPGKQMKAAAAKGPSQPQQPGTMMKQKSRPALQAAAAPAKSRVQLKEYVEPIFVIDHEVVNRIQVANVIPRWYLLQELQALSPSDPSTNAVPITASRDKSMRINYVTGTYFLLLKRRELVELQRRQEGGRSDVEAVRTSIEKSN